ncbi:MAG: efflux RND transporter permease subunit [Nitrospinae bacterium]|nr:efflux RND transporter permease subunit [Nitrospinota bacterium]
MLLSDVSIRRPVFASMMILAVIVFGLFSFQGLGIDRFPRVDMPIVTITTTLEGASLQVMEKDVTDVVEEAVNTINGIKHLRSSTVEGLSLVLVEFELDREIDVAAQEVRDRLATIRKDLPLDIDPPIVEKVDPDAQPIMTIAVFGEMPIGRLTEDVADHLIKRRIERLRGVGQVKIVGGLKREIKAWVDLRGLLEYRLSARDVAEALRRNHLELPGGRVENQKKEYVLRSMGEISRVSDFNQIIVANPPGRPVYFSDIGHIEDGLEEERTLSRLNGRRAVSLFVRKQSGTNTVAVIDAVKAQLEKLKPLLPAGVEVQVVQDQSEFIKQSVDDVMQDIWLGAILTTLIILFFLRSLRTTLVVAVSIPASLIGSFILFQILGFSLNYMTLLGLSLCIGIVVDDSIVVLECIFRHIEEGESPMEAARNGANEIGLATIATTLSIIAIFVPVAYMKGMMGLWFFSFAMTVAATVAISLLVALTVIPMLSSRLLSHQTRHGLIYRLLGRFFDAIDAAYGRLLRVAVHHRFITLILTVVIFFFSLKVAKLVGTEFYVEPDEAQFNVGLKLPVGTSMPRAGQMLAKIEERLRQLPEVVYIYANIGGGSKEKITDASIYVRLTEKWERTVNQREIMRQAREAVAAFPAIKATVERVSPVQRGQDREAPVEFMVKGQDLEKLVGYAEAIMARMRATPGFVDVDSSYEGGKPEIRVEIDRKKAAELGTDVETISSTLRMMVGGEKIAYYKEGGERYEIRVRLYDQDRDEPWEVAKVPQIINQHLLTSSNNLVSLHQDSGPTEIKRHSRARQATVYAQLEGKTLGEAIRDVNGIVQGLHLPPGYFIEFTGRAENMKESFHNLKVALGISTIAIYMVLAAQFESLIHPFTILFSLPLSIIGAFGALLITGYHFDLFGTIGMILLMGIVKKNAILLVDYINTLRRRGMERDEAICRAGPVRLRPILMTSIAVIFGMLPIATGHGAGGEQRATMGIVVIGGNITSTILTLVVIPVLYSFWDDLGKWSGWLWRKLLQVLKKAPRAMPVEVPAEVYQTELPQAGE